MLHAFATSGECYAHKLYKVNLFVFVIFQLGLKHTIDPLCQLISTSDLNDVHILSKIYRSSQKSIGETK